MDALTTIDRTIFELLRLAVVTAGYLPNITDYPTIEEYETAKETLRQSLPDKKLIEVFGVGISENRGGLEKPRITIDRVGKDLGSVGGFPEVKFEKYEIAPDVFKFRKLFYPERTKDLIYDIRYFADTTKYDRILSGIINNELGILRGVRAITDDGTLTGEEILLEQVDEMDVSSTNYKEVLFKYRVPDVYVQGFRLIRDNIPVLETVTRTITTQSSSE